MKARVKATGEIVDVHRPCMSSQGDIWQEKSGREYFVHELDFDVKEPPKPRYNPDYWTRLEHTYAGMAMQGIMNNPIGFENIRARGTNIQIETALLASEFAHALVEKMKEVK